MKRWSKFWRVISTNSRDGVILWESEITHTLATRAALAARLKCYLHTRCLVSQWPILRLAVHLGLTSKELLAKQNWPTGRRRPACQYALWELKSWAVAISRPRKDIYQRIFISHFLSINRKKGYSPNLFLSGICYYITKILVISKFYILYPFFSTNLKLERI
jgi:hypothetical protein